MLWRTKRYLSRWKDPSFLPSNCHAGLLIAPASHSRLSTSPKRPSDTSYRRGKFTRIPPSLGATLVGDPAQKELEAIKRLLILLLAKLGATSEEIGEALGLSSQRVRQLVATAKIKKIAFSEQRKGR